MSDEANTGPYGEQLSKSGELQGGWHIDQGDPTTVWHEHIPVRIIVWTDGTPDDGFDTPNTLAFSMETETGDGSDGEHIPMPEGVLHRFDAPWSPHLENNIVIWRAMVEGFIKSLAGKGILDEPDGTTQVHTRIRNLSRGQLEDCAFELARALYHREHWSKLTEWESADLDACAEAIPGPLYDVINHLTPEEGKTLDLGNNESATRGVFPQDDGTFLALGYYRSKNFKTRRGAEKWLKANSLDGGVK